MKLFFQILLIFTLGMTIMANTIDLKELSGQLPTEIDGWKKSEKQTFYDPENLFEYIDGGAELYISYGFTQMLAQTYQKEGQDDITLDIFDMGNSYNAFGVFSHSREAIDHSIAADVESEYASGLITFWKGRYYVSILAYPESEDKKKTVLALGKHIAGLIQGKSQIPPILAKLPTESLIKESIRYFHNYIWLNSYYFISDDNILHIDKDTEAVLARYSDKQSQNSYFVLLISYPSPAKAETAYRDFMKQFLPDAQVGIKQLEDGKWAGCKRIDDLVKVVLNAPDADTVKGLFRGSS